MAKTDYRKRLLIPHDGHPSMQLFTAHGLLLARGYERVEFGGRGPYLEMTSEQLQHSNVHRIADANHVYFHEFRSNCKSNVMVYLQIRPVDYARYQKDSITSRPLICETKTANLLLSPSLSPERRQPQGSKASLLAAAFTGIVSVWLLRTTNVIFDSIQIRS